MVDEKNMNYDSFKDTVKHISRVRELLRAAILNLEFGISDQLCEILKNTARKIDRW